MADLTYDLEVETAQVYKVRSLNRRTDWANATIRSWPRGGSIDVQSDYGSYSYSWYSIGNGSFLSFLCGLDYDYFMTKARGGYREFDAEAAVKRIKGDVVDRRRHGGLEREKARDLFDEADRYDAAFYVTAEGLGGQFSDEMWRFLDGDFPMVTRDNSQTRGFWDHLWPMLTDAWRKETARYALNDGEGNGTTHG